MVFVYQWNDERQNLTQIPTDVIKFDEGTVVRDIEWDGEHKLWAVTEESGVKVYRSDYDDEWVEDKQVVENIGKLELPQVDTVERAKSVFEWGRKIIKRKREGDDDGDDDDDDDDDGEGGENGQE
ncbi:hypothetical protein EV182_006759 [Spiromyces aspiralis]|uniref:Uncharacterized protein n=1 Tax=Spiromyces aspiralis TaxID=68401 RepID=A0ACC1HBB9_9FUNG|nr:hypothetical protein EV182_006759 [Spiromyces aspiralis]